MASKEAGCGAVGSDFVKSRTVASVHSTTCFRTVGNQNLVYMYVHVRSVAASTTLPLSAGYDPHVVLLRSGRGVSGD